MFHTRLHIPLTYYYSQKIELSHTGTLPYKFYAQSPPGYYFIFGSRFYSKVLNSFFFVVINLVDGVPDVVVNWHSIMFSERMSVGCSSLQSSSVSQ